MTKSNDIGAMFGAGDVETFLGLPKAEFGDDLSAKIALMGIPCATPYLSVGPYCAEGPRAIRDAIAPYAANLQHQDFDIGGPVFPDGQVSAVDLGDLGFSETDFAANRRNIAARIAGLLDQNIAPLVIGGDDSIPVPLFQAFEGRGKFTILQIDAHIDWREEVDGEPWGLSSTVRRASEMPHIERIIQVGQRGLGSARPGDYEDAIQWGVEFISGRDVAARGIGPVLERIPADSQVLIALDCDALDPAIMPGVIGRAPGGMTYWQVVDLIHAVAAKAKIASFNIVEFMPDRDVDQLGALVAARIVVNALAAMARQG